MACVMKVGVALGTFPLPPPPPPPRPPSGPFPSPPPNKNNLQAPGVGVVLLEDLHGLGDEGVRAVLSVPPKPEAVWEWFWTRVLPDED